jgi:hypothetical protein
MNIMGVDIHNHQAQVGYIIYIIISTKPDFKSNFDDVYTIRTWVWLPMRNRNALHTFFINFKFSGDFKNVIY